MKKIAALSLALVAAMAQESLRKQLGKSEEQKHLQAQIRLGYIDADKSGAALAGHLHFFAPLQESLIIGGMLYGVAPIQGSSSDFFGRDRGGFAFLAESYFKYNNANDTLQIGRFMLDTPHADSDDIRLVPNFFEGVWYEKRWEELRIEAGYLRKMAGWENGVTPRKFVRLNEVFGASQKSDGLVYGAMSYERDGAAAALWLYHIDEMADDIYAELSYVWKLHTITLHAAMQYDRAIDNGEALLGELDTHTLGLLLEASYEDLTLQLGMNKEFGDTPSMPSFGGGPFFTSMEDQTIDAVTGKKARSFIAGLSYEYNEKVSVGAMYGKFRAQDRSLYDSNEVDLYTDFSFGGGVDAEILYASIDDNNARRREIFRILLKKDF